ARRPGARASAGPDGGVEYSSGAWGLGFPGGRAQLPLRLTFYDDASEPEQCAALTERLIIEEQADILLGPYSSGLALRAAEMAQHSRRVLWNHGGASEAIYPRGFTWVGGLLAPPLPYFCSLMYFVW